MICALLFFATTINYIDRQVLGILATDDAFKAQIGWNEAEYGFVNTAFQAAYAIGLLVVGGLMDKFGTRKGFSFAMVFWSVASMGHSRWLRSAFGFGVGTFFSRFRRSGKFSGGNQNSRRVVSEKGTRFCDGNFQFRLEHRRNSRPVDCAVYRRQLRLGMGVYRYRRTRFHLARFLARRLSQTGRTSEIVESGTRLYSIG